MCRRVRMGEDLPVRTGVRQRTFLSLPNTVGKPLPVETPEPLGPRNRFQASSALLYATQKSRHSNRGIPQLSHSGLRWSQGGASRYDSADSASSTDLPSAVSSTLDCFTSIRPSIDASSQTVCRGQLLRHTSIASS